MNTSKNSTTINLAEIFDPAELPRSVVISVLQYAGIEMGDQTIPPHQVLAERDIRVTPDMLARPLFKAGF